MLVVHPGRLIPYLVVDDGLELGVPEDRDGVAPRLAPAG